MENKKILFISGASSDVGSALIRKVSDEFDIILAHYNRSKECILSLQKEMGGKIYPLHADLSDSYAVENMIAEVVRLQYEPTHIVHLAAPKLFNQKFHKIQWDSYEKDIETSLHSIVEILKEFLPCMSKKRFGKVVFMLTSCVLNNPPKYKASYVTVKYALLGLMKSLAVEYASRGITINAVSPEMMETKFLSDIPKLIVEQNAKESALGRNLYVEEVISAFEFLLSDNANAVTGLNLKVTGGNA